MRGSGASGDAHSGRSGGDWTVPGYADEQELGAGAGGRVVTAVHTATGRSVAIKYLSEELSADDAFRDAFRDEAELLGSLQTPHVVRLYEYVESAAGAAIVMELVDGMPLRALLRQEGPTGPEAALVVLKGSLLGLAAAHGSGVVHRDYKPENVLVTRDGQSKLVDFGIARRSGSRAPSGPEGPGSPGSPGGGPEGRAGSEAVTGTPPYMAPEQWTGAPADTATDVYAATVTFYECLTGARPFRGETVIELAVQHTTAPVPVDGLPEPVRGLVLHGMAKSPVDRPENATAFLAELERVAGAAYGPGWEERGRRRLAALAALLPLLFPGPRTAPDGSTALAVTRLPAAPPTMPPPRVPVPGGGGSSLIATLAALVVAVLVMTGSLVVGWAGENEASAEATTGVPTSSPQDSPSDDGGEGTGGSGSGSDGDEGGDGDGNGGQGGDSIGESSAVGTTGDPGGTGSTGSTGGTGGSGDTGSTGSTGSTSGSGDTGSTGSTPQEETALSAVDITDMWVQWEDADKGGCECWVAYATVVLTVDGPDTVEVAADWYETSSDRDPGTLVGSETWVVGSDSNGQTLTVVQRNIRGYECGVYYRLDVYPLSPSEGASDSDSVYAGCLR